MAQANILVVVDPTREEQPAVERAKELALKTGASLELFICHYDPDIAAGIFSSAQKEDDLRAMVGANLKSKLEALAAPARDAGIAVETCLVWDYPLDAGIIRKVSASRPWMVVKDTHHHNVLERTILTNTDWNLIRQCPAPLLLVKLEPQAASWKICAAIDPTHEHDKPAELDEEILWVARNLAAATGGELHVVHTYPVVTEPVGLEAPAIGKFADTIRQEHEAAFNEFVNKHRLPAASAHLVGGLAHERLVEFTSEMQFGVVVMGAVSRSGLGRIFIGSTAERVLDRLPCDLLIVKTARLVSALMAA